MIKAKLSVGRLVAAAGLAIALTMTGAHAETWDSSRVVSVGPINSGPVVTQGTAAFDNAGIGAAATASTSQTGTLQNLSSGLTFTYTPIPDTRPPARQDRPATTSMTRPASSLEWSAYPTRQRPLHQARPRRSLWPR